jgi:hypothetical protein
MGYYPFPLFKGKVPMITGFGPLSRNVLAAIQVLNQLTLPYPIILQQQVL